MGYKREDLLWRVLFFTVGKFLFVPAQETFLPDERKFDSIQIMHKIKQIKFGVSRSKRSCHL